MKNYGYQPDIIDFARQILTIYNENLMLREELEHYKEMHAMHCKTINNIDKNQKEFVGSMFSSLIDPDSPINKGAAALLEKEVKLLSK